MKNIFIENEINKFKIDSPTITTSYDKSYSQCLEDCIIFTILNALAPELLNSKNLTYLDIGANHPIATSNTYLFYQKGISGVLIEPNPYFHEMITKVRPLDTLISGVIGIDTPIGKTKPLDFYIPNHHELASLDINFIKDWYHQFGKDNNLSLTELSKISVCSFNINDIVDKYIGNTACILDIDVEGLDFDIINTLNISKYNIITIIIELVEAILGREYVNKTIALLKENGYSLYSKTRVNHIFVKNTLLNNTNK